jgi:CSLREA domain-containing protein
MITRERKKATGKVGNREKEKRDGPLAVFLIVIFQILGWICFSMATAIPVEAVTFTVNSTLDEADKIPGDGVCLTASGNCTLRAAIQEANALAGSDVIKLQKGLYMLTIFGPSENACATGDLDITDFLTITGKGAKNTFINGGKFDRVFHIIGSISVTITDMTIQNGLATDDGYGNKKNVYGGGILNDSASTLILKGITLSNNTAQGDVKAQGDVHVRGGGICNLGTLEITKSTLSNNGTVGGSDGAGGANFNEAGTAIISSTTISNNIASGVTIGGGGGVYNHVGVLEIEKSTISNNTASTEGDYGQGGGIENNGTLTITQSTISNNKATTDNGGGDGGGILSATFAGEVVTITKSTISNNVARGIIGSLGGGICSFAGDVVIEGSILSNNACSGGMPLPGRAALGLGGGIYFTNGTLTVQAASKIVSNFSSDEGGGIFTKNATLNISDTTVANNIPDDM